jgi:hypothetical protein
MEDGRIYLLTTDNRRGQGLLWDSDNGLKFGHAVLGFDRLANYVPPATLEQATNFRGKKFERPQVLTEGGHPMWLYVASGVNLNRGKGSANYVFRIKRPNP